MKRTLDRAARDVVYAMEHDMDLTKALEALREAVRVEKQTASERARTSYARRLTPEQREASIARAQARIDRLTGLGS